jgi:hypothetical protein
MHRSEISTTAQLVVNFDVVTGFFCSAPMQKLQARVREKSYAKSRARPTFHLSIAQSIGKVSSSLSVDHGYRQRIAPDPAAGISGELNYGLSPLLNDTLARFSCAPTITPYRLAILSASSPVD